MPSRNINLTDHYDAYVSDALASGRYKNASELVRAGLRLLEQRDAEDAAKLEALRTAVAEGVDAYERGDFTRMENDADVDQFFSGIEREVDSDVETRG